MSRIRAVMAGLAVVSGVLMLTPGAAWAANPGFIGACNYSHSSQDDPIVHFGKPGAAHLHDFIGNQTTDFASTFDSLRAGGTKCTMTGDASAYWVPALFKDGARVTPTATMKNALAYYRRAGVRDGVTVQNFPPGFRMIIGHQHAMSPAENQGITSKNIIFKCGPGSTMDLSAPPAQCSSGIMVISYKFPNCWDGRNVDSADHISHVAYPMGGGCPASHPVPLPRLEMFIRYLVGTAPIGTVTLSSGPYYTAHMDFFNGWRPQAMQYLLDNCINNGRDCGKNPMVPMM